MAAVVLGVIGSDVHNVGASLLRHALEAGEFRVIYLGVTVPPDEFVKAAIETNAAAILVSSVYGHAEIDCRDLRQMCIEAGT